MRWFGGRGRGAPGGGTGAGGGRALGGRSLGGGAAREAERATRDHLAAFAASRVGVEAYLEPETRSTPMTVVLVAVTGEWTRRRVPDVRAARALATDLGIPLYDVHKTGYPDRMRTWTSRQRRAGRA